LKQQYFDMGLVCTKLNNPQIKRLIEVAIEMGTIILVEDMPERPCIHVESLVK
jgi:hypothetical protein